MGYLGTSEKNSSIIVLPEEIQPVLNRTGQLGDAGRMSGHGDGGFTLGDMLLNPQKQLRLWKDLTSIQCVNTSGYCSQLSLAALCCTLAPDIAFISFGLEQNQLTTPRCKTPCRLLSVWKLACRYCF